MSTFVILHTHSPTRKKERKKKEEKKKKPSTECTPSRHSKGLSHFYRDTGLVSNEEGNWSKCCFLNKTLNN